MAESIKLNGNKYIDAEGVWDSNIEKPQEDVNEQIINASSFSYTEITALSYYETSKLKRKTFQVVRAGNDTVVTTGIDFNRVILIEGFGIGSTFRVPVGFSDAATNCNAYVTNDNLVVQMSTNVSTAYITLTYGS